MSPKHLVIVESAAKAKTIEKYLHDIPELRRLGSFRVMASLGHVRDLPMKELGVEPGTWAVRYELASKKRDLVAKLRAAAKEAEVVWLASDPDREGEAIAQHLLEVLGGRTERFRRVAFHEITRRGLRDAFLSPRDIDGDMVRAQEARRILDRIVGYEVSPLLWRRFATSSLSAGRVQSAALKMIVDRYQEAKTHQPEPFWTCEATFTALPCKAHQGKEVAVWHTLEEARDFLKHITHPKAIRHWVASFAHKTVTQNPPPPFITSSLQQEAYQRHGFTAKRTMQLAQALYEAGLITYMRTDSTQIAQDAIAHIAEYVAEEYSTEAAQARTWGGKAAAHAQEAHECIRPTNVRVRPSAITDEALTPAHRKLYDLIHKRAVASQMVAAEYAQVTYTIRNTLWKEAATPFFFEGSNKILRKPGYLEVWEKQAKEEASTGLPQHGTATPVTLETAMVRGDVSRPPPLYHEPALVKALEKEGIGRPSTFATILDKLQSKGYVVSGEPPSVEIEVAHCTWNAGSLLQQTEVIRVGGRDKDKLLPTSLGERVVGYLQEVVPKLLDAGFTSDMEGDLDRICTRAARFEDVLDAFYGPFQEALSAARATQAAEGAKPRNKKDPTSLAPKNVARSFETADVVQTRFGMALFERATKRFVSLAPYLEWKGRSVADLTEKDAAFLLSFPRSLDGTQRVIAYGPYGLYVKDGAQNIPMPDKALWDATYDDTITAHDIDALQKKNTGASAYAFKRKSRRA
jgi:DNA topoisomerase I